METESSAQSVFARALGDLKRRGSNLLVVGGPAPAAHEAACERLLGESSDCRERVVVLTDGSFDRSAALEGRVDASVLTFPSATRGGTAVATTSTASESGGPSTPVEPRARATRRVSGTDLGTLAATIDDELEAGTAGEPGGLRLCFDSLLPVLEEHDRAEVKHFLTAVGNRVRAARGMAHYHLPVTHSDDVVGDIEAAFDAVVEVRSSADGVQQRWRILEDDIDSGWLDF